MTSRFRFWQLSLLLIGGCALVLTAVLLFQRYASSSNEWLFQRLPIERALVVGIDVKALRQAGLLEQLASAGVIQESDYTEFVEQTGFDYRQDLDYVVISWSPDRRDILARGRFDWKQLSEYAIPKGGKCWNTFCDIDGSVPSRKISFFPASTDVVAISVAQSQGAAWILSNKTPGPRLEKIPVQPVWLSMGSDWIEQNQSYPAGLRSFLSALRGANQVQLGVGASGSGLELTLDAECLTAETASRIHQQLSAATALLSSMITRQGMTPNPDDLSGVLSSGKFEIQGLNVKGRWPITPAFLSNFARGSV